MFARGWRGWLGSSGRRHVRALRRRAKRYPTLEPLRVLLDYPRAFISTFHLCAHLLGVGAIPSTLWRGFEAFVGGCGVVEASLSAVCGYGRRLSTAALSTGSWVKTVRGHGAANTRHEVACFCRAKKSLRQVTARILFVQRRFTLAPALCHAATASRPCAPSPCARSLTRSCHPRQRP